MERQISYRAPGLQDPGAFVGFWRVLARPGSSAVARTARRSVATFQPAGPYAAEPKRNGPNGLHRPPERSARGEETRRCLLVSSSRSGAFENFSAATFTRPVNGANVWFASLRAASLLREVVAISASKLRRMIFPLELEQLGRGTHGSQFLHIGGNGFISRLGFSTYVLPSDCAPVAKIFELSTTASTLPC